MVSYMAPPSPLSPFHTLDDMVHQDVVKPEEKDRRHHVMPLHVLGCSEHDQNEQAISDQKRTDHFGGSAVLYHPLLQFPTNVRIGDNKLKERCDEEESRAN